MFLTVAYSGEDFLSEYKLNENLKRMLSKDKC